MALENAELGRAVAEIRKLRGLTQRAVAERTGLTVNYLSLVENGDRAVSLEGLNRLAEALGVPPDWIVLWAREGRRRPGEDPKVAELIRLTKEAMRATLAPSEPAPG
jgi:transcriptional regulator with XRE-family HTH domain